MCFGGMLNLALSIYHTCVVQHTCVVWLTCVCVVQLTCVVQHTVVASRQRVVGVWSAVRLQNTTLGIQRPQLVADLHHQLTVRYTLYHAADLTNSLRHTQSYTQSHVNAQRLVSKR